MFQRHNLHASLEGIGVKPELDIFDELAEAYGAPSRHYHSQRHVAECLSILNEYRDLAEHPSEVEIAIWFHDAIYDTRRFDNEEMSAQWAERYLTSENANPKVIERIANLILATKTHDASCADANLLVDIDLAILGGDPAVFEAYDQAIRREFDWVPEAPYRTARIQILQAFLDRESIYKTSGFQRRYETKAQENMARKITELRSCSKS